MNQERRLLSKIVTAGGIETVMKAGITPDMFEDQQYGQVFAFLLDFFDRHGVLPSAEVFKRNCPWFETMALSTGCEEGEEPFLAPDPLAFYVDEMLAQHRYSLLYDALVEAGAFMKQRDAESAWAVVEKLVEQRPPTGGGLAFEVVEEDAEDEEVPWVCAPWLALGTTTEVTGKVKQAGKTTFVLSMVRAILDGGHFLDRRAMKTGVVLLSEQNKTSLRASLRRAGLLGREGLYVSHWAGARAVPWPEVVRAAVAQCEAVGADVLIVDTLSQWAGLRGDAENDAGRAMEAMGPLLAAAGDGLAVLVVRHDRKSGGAVGDSGRGSSAFAGSVDIALNIRRGSSLPPTSRVVSGLSRLDGVPEEVVVDWDGSRYCLIGDMSVIKATEKAEEIQAEILAVMRSKPGQEWSQRGLRDELRRGADLIRLALEDLINSAKVRRFGTDARPKYALSQWN